MTIFPSKSVLLATCLMLLGSAPAAARDARNVVIVTIDTLRADHLACYGYDRIKTPNIDQLAKTGVQFANALTPVPITLPAHTALMRQRARFRRHDSCPSAAAQRILDCGIHRVGGSRFALRLEPGL
jgi:hypothetical protein